MTSSNPSHILIGRHTRGTHPSTSPIETHAAATGVFRLASAAAALGSPPLGELALLEDDEVPELDVTEDNGGVIELDPTFVRDARLPGSVKIVVESTTFWYGYPLLQVVWRADERLHATGVIRRFSILPRLSSRLY
jgi:hypothetical protein